MSFGRGEREREANAALGLHLRVGFCQQHEVAGSVLAIPHFHIKASCRIPVRQTRGMAAGGASCSHQHPLQDLGLTVASWFHYGLAEEKETWYIPEQPGGFVDNPAPTSVEARLTALFLPDAEKIGSPDLIILNSFFWVRPSFSLDYDSSNSRRSLQDLRFFALHARHYGRGTSLEPEERPLTWNELEWHRGRVATYVRIFQVAFPNAKIMFRLGTFPLPSLLPSADNSVGQAYATNRNGGNVGAFQLNSSIRAVLQQLGVPVFECASLALLPFRVEAGTDDQAPSLRRLQGHHS